MSEHSQIQRFFIHLAYNGSAYHGWQVQPGSVTVQQRLEEALAVLLKEQVRTTGCGRTDTGVHASDFYAHFESGQLSDPDWLVYKINHVLPSDIAVYRCFPVTDDQHARYSATARTYEYHLHDHKDPFLSGRSVIIGYTLDIGAMQDAANWLLTVRDFASFCKAGGNQKTTICEMSECRWERHGHRIVFTVCANRFLRNMVRSLVGTFLDVGRGKLNLEEFKLIVEARDRKKAGTSAPAEGLFLTKVEYPFS